ncbi:Hydrogenase maturation protease HycI [Halorhabdus sp. SVX81]|uniref:hydrogenase maturation protease n=1 Tax=Halorhabdus sp. SVX81 TaxID=2978283 RepID=UPI0023DC1BCB|nr:hydrogenase maturation protease [Halorhabdus sp. SVX81]WEL18504.1 Hydrogenase maturation protease HycI [Halorhabdus sp. SVX81]
MTTPPQIDAADRVALVGMGSELRGDDAVGLEVVRRLDGIGADRLRVIEGGVAPENQTGVIRRFEPDWIVLVDAIAFGGDPGDSKWIESDDLGGESFSSHKSTPAMLETFLTREMDADVALFGVEPARIEFGTDLSSAVQQRLDDLVAELSDALGATQ